ncbi:MAG: ATP-binding cassette domain-containing protein [bacterium]
MAILEAEDISLQIEDTTIIDGLNAEFWGGHIHAVIGPNGAGKSSLAGAIMGLKEYRSVDGKILFDDKDITEFTPDQRADLGITMAWQEPARFEGLKVKKFIGCGIENPDPDKIVDVLNKVGLRPEEYMDRAVDETLSGGERKRIELASILMMNPRLVLLDEPDSGIDVGALEKIFDAIHYMKKQGITVILITHSMTVLEQADHAFLLCDGKIIDKGNPEKIGEFFREKCMPCSDQDAHEKKEEK